jgi:KDO2-lipid IV(A) lauroyltransferase
VAASAVTGVLLRLLARLPWTLLYGLAAVAAWLLQRVLRYRVAVARDNLTRAFPARSPREVDALLTHYYRQVCQVAVEFVKLGGLSAAQLRAHVQTRDARAVHAELAAGRPVLLLAAHHCNWEWALQGTTLEIGAPLIAAYKPLHSAAADRELLRLRARFGAHMVPAKKLLREVARRRGSVHAVALMADQVPFSSGSRHWLTFLGRDTAFYPGPAEIARSTGYAAFFVPMHRLARGRYEIDFVAVAAAGERLEPAEFTARYARLVERQIEQSPGDWTWTHRRWKLQPPPAESPPVAS